MLQAYDFVFPFFKTAVNCGKLLVGYSQTQGWYLKASEVEGTKGHVTEKFIKIFNQKHNVSFYKNKKTPFSPHRRQEMY